MKHYTVNAKRWERGWELHIEGVGVTQTSRLSYAEREATDYVCLLTGDAPSEFTVDVVPSLGRELDRQVRAAKSAAAELAEMQRSVGERNRAIAKTLRTKGFSGAEIAAVLGVSAQRVSQLSAEVRPVKNGRVATQH